MIYIKIFLLSIFSSSQTRLFDFLKAFRERYIGTARETDRTEIVRPIFLSIHLYIYCKEEIMHRRSWKDWKRLKERKIQRDKYILILKERHRQTEIQGDREGEIYRYWYFNTPFCRSNLFFISIAIKSMIIWRRFFKGRGERHVCRSFYVTFTSIAKRKMIIWRL